MDGFIFHHELMGNKAASGGCKRKLADEEHM